MAFKSTDQFRKELLQKESVIDEFKIHPKNFALARAMAGDPSDNLAGIKGAGLKTIAKRFPYLIRDNEYEVGDIVKRLCDDW
jgi:5'-3' exonuclease